MIPSRTVTDRKGQPTVPTPRAPRCQRCTPATQGSMVSRTVVTEELLLLLPGCSPTKGVLAGHHILAHRDATPAAVRASISYASGMPFGAANRATRRHGGCGTNPSPCAEFGELIFWVFQESALKRSHFAAGLGYLNITGGLRSLDAWLQTGTGDPLLIERLVQSYGVDPRTVRRALAETDAQHNAEYAEAVRRQEQWDKEHFRQFVFVETPSGAVQSSFTVAAIVAPCLKFIHVPERLSPETRR